jgi:hypothetical protein
MSVEKGAWGNESTRPEGRHRTPCCHRGSRFVSLHYSHFCLISFYHHSQTSQACGSATHKVRRRLCLPEPSLRAPETQRSWFRDRYCAGRLWDLLPIPRYVTLHFHPALRQLWLQEVLHDFARSVCAGSSPSRNDADMTGIVLLFDGPLLALGNASRTFRSGRQDMAGALMD